MNNSKNRFLYVVAGVVIIASAIFNSRLVSLAHAASINDSGYQSFDDDSAGQSSSSETQTPPSTTDDQSSSGEVTSTADDTSDTTPAAPTETDGYAFGATPGIVETTNQSLENPVSDILIFHAENTTPAHHTTKASSKTTPSSSKTKTVPSPQPYIPSSATVVTSIDYTLDGKPLHTTTTFPDTWEFDTKTIPNGGFTLAANYHYADGSTRSSTTLVFPHNKKTIIQSITDVFRGVWQGMKEVFHSTKK